MNDLFKTLIDEGVIVVYMDDILIFTESLEQHHETVQNALEILRTNHLYLKPDKCLFMQLKVEYPGLILSVTPRVTPHWNSDLHDQGFKEATISLECCLPFISFLLLLF